MPVEVGGIELHMGPTGLGGPDNLEAAILDFLGGAKHTLAIAVQELDSPAIAEAIIAAKQSGVSVRAILEGDYLSEAPARVDPWAVAGAHEENRRIHAALLRANVDLITDLNPAIFHQKFIVRDRGKPTAAVLTGSTNFTRTDTGAAVDGSPSGGNLNHVLVLHGKEAANQYLLEFERMRSGTFGAMRERVEPRPREFTLGGVRVKPLFAPRHGPEMEIMKQMLKARSSIDFAMFTFARSSGIDDTMARLQPLLPRLRGVLDRQQGAHDWAATGMLQLAGVQLFKNRKGTRVRKLHHKLMVIDERLVIAGSFNYTAPATTLNDENIIVLGDLESTDPEAEAAGRKIARYALDEIERIIADLSEPV